METAQEHWISRHVKEIIIGLIVTTLISMVVALFNLYVASRIYPLNKVDEQLQKDVQALFESDTERKVDHDKVVKIEQQIEGMQENLNNIREDVTFIRNYLTK